MNWTVEATHPATGEELVLRVEAGTREQAAARARDGGLLVRDCYPEGRRFYKVLRTLAWVWSGSFGLMAVATLVIGIAISGTREAFVGFACAGILAVLGLLLAWAMKDALRRDPRPDPRHGFDVVAAPALRQELRGKPKE